MARQGARRRRASEGTTSDRPRREKISAMRPDLVMFQIFFWPFKFQIGSVEKWGETAACCGVEAVVMRMDQVVHLGYGK